MGLGIVLAAPLGQTQRNPGAQTQTGRDSSAANSIGAGLQSRPAGPASAARGTQRFAYLRASRGGRAQDWWCSPGEALGGTLDESSDKQPRFIECIRAEFIPDLQFLQFWDRLSVRPLRHRRPTDLQCVSQARGALEQPNSVFLRHVQYSKHPAPELSSTLNIPVVKQLNFIVLDRLEVEPVDC